MISINPLSTADIEANTDEQKEGLAVRRKVIFDEVQDFVNFSLELGIGSQSEMSAYIDGLSYIKNEEHITSWEQGLDNIRKAREDGLKLVQRFTELTNDIKKHKPRAISDKSLKSWEERFHNTGVSWNDRHDFVMNELPGYFKRAKEVAVKRKELIEHDEIFTITRKEVPDIAKFIDEDKFLKLHYTERKDLNSQVHAALLAIEKGEVERYASVKSRLESAAEIGVLSKQKVGMWLERIFKSNASRDKIDKFINGSDGTSLGSLIGRWTEVKSDYNEIHEKKKELGPGGMPRRFKFVNESTFLSWHYSKRLAYVNEADKRFEDIEQVNPMLLAVRRELDNEDWESARYLLSRISSVDLTLDDAEKVRSMKRYLVENQSRDAAQEVNPPPEEPEAILEELQELIGYLPLSLQPLYKEAIAAGKIDCLAALMYNRVWCHENQCLDGQKEIVLKEKSIEDTQKRKDEGTKDMYLFNENVDTFQDSSVVSYSKSRINRPQILHAGPRSVATLVSKMQDEDGELFRYWVTLIPEGVDYGTHAGIVKNVNWKIKKKVRALQAQDVSLYKVKDTQAVTPKPKKQEASPMPELSLAP